ncbi:flagellar motor switch protein FliM [Tepidanaerobacter sp. EBM-49]|uniref:flagellar motor switch protein FliM n=1 Tax=Tepidanaerobacter sp. EBM-49 TaxID=1918504 RepID=UPI000ACF8A68|nr:flagellar motor switch protein FliM [Tepidanaerobacter sp. EBM-49]
MSDILSQNEIDALLAALSTGEVKAEEIKKESEKKVKLYDFKRPNKFSKEQLNTLSMIHENFARLLTTYLSAQLRTFVQINVFFVEQMTYNEFISSLPNPSLISVVDFSPLKGAAIMEINPSIAFSIIDRLLGGPGDYSGKLREPTEIETTIIEKIFTKMTSILNEAWKDIENIQTKMEKLETNSQFVQLVSPNEAVALITFNAKIGKTEGMINICIPHIVLEPIMPKLSTRIWLATTGQEQSSSAKEVIIDKVHDTKIQLRVELGRASITIGEFLGLSVGDVIRLNRDIKDGVDVRIKDKLKFSGSVGIHRNKMAVKVQKIYYEKEGSYE